ncbi:MAG TPA: M28 family peptidase [Candidatus Acidoferrales bacterium]|jgi:hypothetical protein|nr:M28 family peptidase [Candidatus Acidoferrales bacterium]
MQFTKLLPALFSTLLLASVPAAAQLKQTEPDPLARIRDATASNVQACSATGDTLCEQVAPKIIANAQGDSPLAKNLESLSDTLNAADAAKEERDAVAWAIAAFREAGLNPHVEKYMNPGAGPTEHENVVAEYPGRENPDEWVLVGAHLAPQPNGSAAIDITCDAAAVAEAARDISLTAVHPKRSIRFVLFTGDESGTWGSWGYVRSHRGELERARAAVLFHSSCFLIQGFMTNGRQDLKSGLLEARRPVESLGAVVVGSDAKTETDDFDFLLEGVPTLSAVATHPGNLGPGTAGHANSKIELANLKDGIATVAVTAFGIAERAAPIGPRQSRAEIESLLETLGLDLHMKNSGTWRQWQSGERGRLP